MFDLYNISHINFGKIYLKIQAIISFKQYYEGEIDNAEKEIEIIQSASDLTNYYVASMRNNFGVLFVENLENLINNQQFQQVDELINILEKNKESIYHKKDNNYTDGDNVLRGGSKGAKITLNTLTKVLMFCLIIFSFVSLLERSDYINLIIAILTLYCFILNKNGMVVNYLKYFIWLLIMTIIFDIIWFLLNFGGYFVGEKGDPETGLKRIIYLVAICCTVIKCLFTLALFNMKKKKLVEYQVDDMN